MKVWRLLLSVSIAMIFPRWIAGQRRRKQFARHTLRVVQSEQSVIELASQQLELHQRAWTRGELWISKDFLDCRKSSSRILGAVQGDFCFVFIGRWHQSDRNLRMKPAPTKQLPCLMNSFLEWSRLQLTTWASIRIRQELSGGLIWWPRSAEWRKAIETEIGAVTKPSRAVLDCC